MNGVESHDADQRNRSSANRILRRGCHFEFGAYDDAAQLFRDVAKQDPEDRAARTMMLKARKLAEGDAYTDA